MTDLPPRFTTDLEHILPPSLALPPDQHSTVSSGTGRSARRWDDPPEDEASAPPIEMPTTMVLVQSGESLAVTGNSSEVTFLAFAPSSAHLIAGKPAVGAKYTVDPTRPSTLMTWYVPTRKRLAASSFDMLPFHGGGNGGPAFQPHQFDRVLVAVPTQLKHVGAASSTIPATGWPVTPWLEIYDLGRGERLLRQAVVQVRAPLAWGPGDVLAGVLVQDPRRIGLVRLVNFGHKDRSYTQKGEVLMGHMDEVTQVEFLPKTWAGGQAAVVSAGRDGYVRVTGVQSGRTLKKIAVAARGAAEMMRITPDGKLVVTVWGRDVVLWYLGSGRVHTYNLDAVRQYECWPLCVSPDCRYLVCRTDEGVVVSDVQTGMFRGECAWPGKTVTAAAVNGHGTLLAVGDYGGRIQMYDMVTS